MTWNDTDLRWIAERRPETSAPDKHTTARARAALLEEAFAAPPAARPVRARAKRPRRRALAVLVPALALAAVVLLALPGKHTPAPSGIGVPEAAAAPVARLAANLRTQAAPAGDATLVIRRQYPGNGEKMIPGADLYVDRGGYFYARTPAGLPARARLRQRQRRARLRPRARSRGGGVRRRHHHRPQRLALSVLEPGTPPPAIADDPAWLDNWVWGNGMDALIAGAGRPEIRAGVLHLYASIKGLTVKDTTSHGRHVLIISAGVFGDDRVRDAHDRRRHRRPDRNGRRGSRQRAERPRRVHRHARDRRRPGPRIGAVALSTGFRPRGRA